MYSTKTYVCLCTTLLAGTLHGASQSPEQQLRDAAHSGKIDEVTSLLEQGANRIESNEHGQLPLHLAAWAGHDAVVEKLLEKSASEQVNYDAEDGNTPLLYAIDKNHLSTAHILLKAKPEKTSLNKALWHAAFDPGSVEIVSMLLEAGADATFSGPNGYRALHQAARHWHVNLIEPLIKKCNIDIRSTDSKTALHVAAENGCAEFVKKLLECGADPNPHDQNEKTPLQLAQNMNYNTIVDLLKPVQDEDKTSEKELFDAAKKGAVEKVKELLGKGVRRNVVDTHGAWPLHYAAQKGSIEIVSLLLANDQAGHTFPVDPRGNDGTTPLHYAAFGGHVDVVNELLSKGADPKITCRLLFPEDNLYPLHVAAKRGHVQLIEPFQKVCDINIGSTQGKTALHFAAENNRKDFVKKLIACDAKRAWDEHYKLASDLAQEEADEARKKSDFARERSLREIVALLNPETKLDLVPLVRETFEKLKSNQPVACLSFPVWSAFFDAVLRVPNELEKGHLQRATVWLLKAQTRM